MKPEPNTFLKSKPLFLVLLPLFFVLHGFTGNYPSVPVPDAIKLLVEYLLIILLATALFYLIFRSWRNAVMYAFILMCFQFFFGALHDLLKDIFPHFFISKYVFILPFIFLIAVLLFFFFRKTGRQFTKAAKYFTFLFLFLIVTDAAILVSKISSTRQENETPAGFITCNDCRKPNIYLIIADEYAGRQELKDFFSFDNTSFENELRKRNFYVVPNPNSNYNYTPYSMASLFSMNYLKGITNKSNDIDNRNTSYRFINKNDLVTILKKTGYDFVNLSLFDFADKPTTINSNQFYSTREKLISGQTLTGRIKKDLWFNLVTTFNFSWAKKNYHDKLANDIQNAYDGMVRAASEKPKQPRFVYTHFIMPHFPYLFDKDGNKIPFEESIQGGRKDLYLGFLQYCNKQCLSLIDTILKKDQTNPVIILMSDHGFTKYKPGIDPSYNFKNMINIYFPGENYSTIPDSISNVNLFRVVLNTEFKQQLPLLKDSTIFLKEY